MRIRLVRRADDEATVTLVGEARLPDAPLRLRYRTRTGALLRIDGVARGAFDAKHQTIALDAVGGIREIALEVERRSLPIAGLPDGDGPKWRLLLARARQQPPHELEVLDGGADVPRLAVDVPLVGHAHLDVAWLWTYAEAKRKAMRTFGNALREIERDPRFVFAQSMPQLYAWVGAADPAVLERVRTHVRDGWDASVASMWVEPDLHAPSGESILRQFAHAIRWMTEHVGVAPTVAWLPDSFGFPSTFPTLAAHAGVPYFLTTKLLWNERNAWPFPQFRWRGDDGSVLTAAVVAGYEGALDGKKLRTAARRGELAIHGWGDGGGGPTDEDLAAVPPDRAPWTPADRWLAEVASRELPEHRGELYLETHRGTYTTNREAKQRNAELEGLLDLAEERAAWCVAIGAPPAVLASLRDGLRDAWRIVLRAQFHDVVTGTAIRAVYDDAHEEWNRALMGVERVLETARAVLPRTDLRLVPPQPRPPRPDGDGWILQNDALRARIRRDGTIDELAGASGRNLVALANGLAAFVDRPKHWDAWNLDEGYRKRAVRVRPSTPAQLVDEGVALQLRVGRSSRAGMTIALLGDEPWLRVELNVHWRERHVILRAEHRVALPAREVRYGQPHGTLVRGAYRSTPAERARFEVPAQRWAHVTDGDDGLAVFARDLYGWSADGLPGGGVRLGTSLLRSPVWPNATSDRGEHRLGYALVPTAGATVSALENAWQLYATQERVRLFTCDDPAVLVVATYPADDGDGVVVRVRECDGAQRQVRLRCGARARSASAIDAVERPRDEPVALEGEDLVFPLPAYALRSMRVRF